MLKRELDHSTLERIDKEILNLSNFKELLTLVIRPVADTAVLVTATWFVTRGVEIDPELPSRWYDRRFLPLLTVSLIALIKRRKIRGIADKNPNDSLVAIQQNKMQKRRLIFIFFFNSILLFSCLYCEDATARLRQKNLKKAKLKIRAQKNPRTDLTN